MRSVVALGHFDGERHHAAPATLVIDRGHIVDILRGEHAIGERVDRHAFVMPGLVEAHCHLFLNGGDLDLPRRAEYLKAPLETMMQTARESIRRHTAHGVTLVRDAGDRYGVNHRVRAEAAAACSVRSAGIALRRPGRYGAFMAREIASIDDARAAVREAAADSDDLKIIQTGIIDFEAGAVKGDPQFDADTLRLIVDTAHEAGMRTFAHCSGTAGIEVAIEAGVDSIEHGFFMTRNLLEKMAAQGTAWVPTFAPVDFQHSRPEVAGWSPQTVENLRRILDSHCEHVAMASGMGVNLVAGSDAGSLGVEHGRGLVHELFRFLDCGMSMAQVLQAATTVPRRLWGAQPADIRVGNRVDLAVMDADPFAGRDALLRVSGVDRETPASP